MSEQAYSRRQMRKKRYYVKIEGKIEPSKFHPISLLLTVLPIMLMIYLTIKYFGAPWVPYAITLISLSFVAIIGLLIINEGNIFTYHVKFIKDPILINGLIFFILLLTLTVILLVVWAIFGGLAKLAMSKVDLYFYYGSSAILEELFFRMFLISIFDKKLKKKWIGLFISPVAFSLAHFTVYGQDIFSMLSTLFCGLFLSIYYIGYKDITVPMLAHLIINLIATGNLLIQA